ncbi:MAG: sigma-54-dependent Fis family transcriptional regulator [Nitrospirae bacterium]|nr:sigma-54-dependent Fis family transcriptional regulator [Nitrospirota bacterium]
MVFGIMPEHADLTQVLKKRNNKLSILYEIALTVGKSLDLKAILDDVLEKIIGFMGVDAGVIYVINDETLEMIPVTFRNLTDEVVKDLCENKVKVGECMCGSIAQCDREVVIYEKASLDPRFTRGVLKKEGMEFYAGLPIKARGKVVGVLCVITHAAYSPDTELLDILRAATLPIGLAIENALIFDTIRRDVADRSGLADFREIITNSERMHEVLSLVKKILNVPTSVLICGESGTGKELIARAIHYNSKRAEKPFIPINCAALPETLLESELFGHAKGSFTGAVAEKAGFLEAADGGTLFLDEVNSMSTNLQLKLLRFLQDQTFYRVGSTDPVSVEVRVIAATNQDIEEKIRQGSFREDLYYRLNVMKIDLPALRDRKEDIPLLARYFTEKYSRKFDKSLRGISDHSLMMLMRYPWPGNIRELENAMERAVIMADSPEISAGDLPLQLISSVQDTVDWSLQRIEQDHIANVLSITKGEMKKAAEILGINQSTLWRKLRKMNTPHS